MIYKMLVDKDDNYTVIGVMNRMPSRKRTCSVYHEQTFTKITGVRMEKFEVDEKTGVVIFPPVRLVYFNPDKVQKKFLDSNIVMKCNEAVKRYKIKNYIDAL